MQHEQGMFRQQETDAQVATSLGTVLRAPSYLGEPPSLGAGCPHHSYKHPDLVVRRALHPTRIRVWKFCAAGGAAYHHSTQRRHRHDYRRGGRGGGAGRRHRREPAQPRLCVGRAEIHSRWLPVGFATQPAGLARRTRRDRAHTLPYPDGAILSTAATNQAARVYRLPCRLLRREA